MRSSVERPLRVVRTGYNWLQRKRSLIMPMNVPTVCAHARAPPILEQEKFGTLPRARSMSIFNVHSTQNQALPMSVTRQLAFGDDSAGTVGGKRWTVGDQWDDYCCCRPPRQLVALLRWSCLLIAVLIMLAIVLWRVSACAHTHVHACRMSANDDSTVCSCSSSTNSTPRSPTM